MSELNKLCYSASADALAFKANNTDEPLIYKVKAGDWTMISFAWGSDGKDLDICAYWVGADSMKMGYGYNKSTTEQVSGAYHIFYSGDEQSTNASEWCKVKMIPWSSGDRTFKVHFNYYGYDSSHTLSTCTVIASQDGGETLIKRNQSCSTIEKRAATTSDPYCVVTFDATGKLVSLE